MEEWSCGSVEGLRGGGVEAWRSGGVEVWRGGGVEEWRTGDVEGWRCGLQRSFCQGGLSSVSDPQTGSELGQTESAVRVAVAVLGELLGAAARLEPAPQVQPEGAGLSLAQHAAAVRVQLEEVPAQGPARVGGWPIGGRRGRGR